MTLGLSQELQVPGENQAVVMAIGARGGNIVEVGQATATVGGDC